MAERGNHVWQERKVIEMQEDGVGAARLERAVQGLGGLPPPECFTYQSVLLNTQPATRNPRPEILRRGRYTLNNTL